MSVWIFGYGSLVWRPDFPFLEKRQAAITGWTRRFWQGSTDHRGVPGAPGRVVTLVADPNAKCWGTAYFVSEHERDEILDQLAYREKGGYDRIELPLEFVDPEHKPASAFVYFANEANPNYLGPATLEAIADQVIASHGPSGANIEYVLQLADALRTMAVEDAHVFALADLVERGRA